MGAVEEKLADKQMEDPLLAEPLLTLEEEEEEEGTDESAKLEAEFKQLQASVKETELEKVPLYDPHLF